MSMIHIEEFWRVEDGNDWAPAFLRVQQAVTQGGRAVHPV
jgi:hypothetical protein